ncbi:MAG: hypothetical protein AB7O28_20835, partial [Vicinamibacterales bacterium]
MAAPSLHVVLTRHFLRRFLENDLVAPEADRTQLLAVVGAALVSTTLFLTMMSGFKYLVGVYTPGQAAVASLDDKLFYLSVSMVVVALLTVAQWDALVVDARDAAILDPLPVTAAAVRQAKLAAVSVFGLAATALVNLVPTLLFPLFLVGKQPVSLADALAVAAAHAVATLGASAFGFLAVVACRETLSAMLGARWFAQVSSWVQAALIVGLGAALLLIPATSGRVERTALSAPAFMAAPPAWFLGAYEAMAGHVLADAPRSRLRGRQIANDARFTAAYRRHGARFDALARRAALALPAVALAAVAAYLLNARRGPASHVTAQRLARTRRRPLRRATLARGAALAGFWFTLAVLWRSHAHRLTIACAGAAGLALSLVALAGADAEALAAGRIEPRLLIVQPFLVGALLVGFRHAIRVPAELRANWGFQLAWRGDVRAFVRGARRAALLGLALPALAAVFLLDAVILGTPLALAHAVFGAAAAVLLLDALMLGYEKVPFTCS